MGHANLLCIVPILTDNPRRESKVMDEKVMRWKKKSCAGELGSPEPVDVRKPQQIYDT